MGDILDWLKSEERRLRDRIGAVHGDSPQYHSQGLKNQAEKFAEAASEIEQLREELGAMKLRR